MKKIDVDILESFLKFYDNGIKYLRIEQLSNIKYKYEEIDYSLKYLKKEGYLKQNNNLYHLPGINND